MDKVILVSTDGHCGPPAEAYRAYLEARYHPDLDLLIDEEKEYTAACSRIGSYSPSQLEVVDRDGAIATGGLTGAWDLGFRLREMDREGVAAELLLQGTQLATSPFFGFQNRPYPADVRMAGVRAFNRWAADLAADADGRLIPIAEQTPVPDLDETLAELRWAADHGFRGTVVPGAITDEAVPLPPFYDPYWEPFWATCAELDFALVLHVGLGLRQGDVLERFKERAKTMSGDYRRDVPEPNMMETAAEAGKADDLFALNYSPRQALWQMMIGGVFDRHPNLRFVPTEARADWVPATLAHMDARFDQGGTPLLRRPSEYWASNCFVGASFIHRAELEQRSEIGVSTLMFGRDYPHPEGTWPNTLDWIRAAFAGVPETDARLILGENAMRCYGLDRTRLAAVAERVGPEPEQLLVDTPVDPRMVTEFDKRGGFNKPAPVLARGVLDQIIEGDLVGAASL